MPEYPMERIKVLVPISGGKDSQASLKLALQTLAARSAWPFVTRSLNTR